MKISNISKHHNQNFGMRYSLSMFDELQSVYSKLKHNHGGFQTDFLDNVLKKMNTIIPNGFLDYRLTTKGFLGLNKEKQCYIYIPHKTNVMLWNKKSGLFSKDKNHLTAEDIFEIAQKIDTLNIKA